MTILLVLGFFGYEMFWKSPKPLAESADSSAEIVGEDILILVEKQSEQNKSRQEDRDTRNEEFKIVTLYSVLVTLLKLWIYSKHL
ncbi:MAG: hypothetical protein UT81_C0024G0006 [Parcubacteria group bacterium GW2011_GWA2_40_14]|nr:MAG: hypothetical protein UT81_C0024G0006 [Parcubacteria group bacterium GW2011_GWA2_40_14]